MPILWHVFIGNKVGKQVQKLPPEVNDSFKTLHHQMRQYGPYCYEWKNYGKIKGHDNIYHCHIKSGRPTYVVYWVIWDKKNQIVEVLYAGTHEKAPKF